MYHDRIREFCAICVAALVTWMAYTWSYESGWYLVYVDQLGDWLMYAGGLIAIQAALIIKGVLS